MRSALTGCITLALLLALTGGATADTVGADLSRPANNARTCETGFFDPAVIAGTGFPYQSFASCTWWSTGSLQGAESAVVPFGGGIVKRVRVKVGAVTGRMQVVALRLTRHPGSLSDPACCFPAGHGPVFTPAANATSTLTVDIPVKHETDPQTGIVNYDVLALSVLDAGVPMPAHASNDGGFGGLVAGMFPAYVPGEERTAGYGTVMAGHVLLQADVEPATTLTPPPADGVVFATSPKSLRVAKTGRFTYRFVAPALASGTIRLKSATKVKIGAKKRFMKLATRSFTAPSTTRVKVKYKLSRKHLKALNRAKKLRFKVTATLAGKTTTTTLTLKAPKKT
ncbi:MAG: hypothetical protein ACRDKY_02570 [Solirubrobacteraceae bacterium]